jgi:hypothetical protein
MPYSSKKHHRTSRMAIWKPNQSDSQNVTQNEDEIDILKQARWHITIYRVFERRLTGYWIYRPAKALLQLPTKMPQRGTAYWEAPWMSDKPAQLTRCILWRVYPLLGNDSVHTYRRTHNNRSCVLCGVATTRCWVTQHFSTIKTVISTWSVPKVYRRHGRSFGTAAFQVPREQ